MHLHPIINDTNGRCWCGPGAIAAITGLPLSQVKEAIYAMRGQRRVTRMTEYEVRDTLLHMGYRPSPPQKFPSDDRPSLARWLRERLPHQLKPVYLVNLTGHFMVAKGRKIVDNSTLTPVWIGDAPYRRAKVVSIRRINR